MCDLKKPSILKENTESHLHEVHRVNYEKMCLTYCGDDVCDCSAKKEDRPWGLYDVYKRLTDNEAVQKDIDNAIKRLYTDNLIREVPTVGADQQTDIKSDKTTDTTNNEVK